MEFQKTILFLRIHLRRFFFVSFLLFLLSQKKKQEKPDGKRKKKKGFLGHACRLIKFPCVKRGEFYLLSCVTCGHSTSANSAGPNHSLRIRWFCGNGGRWSFVLVIPGRGRRLDDPKNRTVIEYFTQGDT